MDGWDGQMDGSDDWMGRCTSQTDLWTCLMVGWTVRWTDGWARLIDRLTDPVDRWTGWTERWNGQEDG